MDKIHTGFGLSLGNERQNKNALVASRHGQFAIKKEHLNLLLGNESER